METSIFAFATDLADEGLETVLDNVQGRGGLGGITVAAAYHEGRDVFPHNPRHKVRFLEGGAVFFPPDPARWRGVRLRPPVSEVADVFPELIAASASRGLSVHAWTVFLHNGALAAEHPDCAPENAFGDRYVTDLCPAHPDVRAFAVALAGDVARLGVASISAESLHFHALEHGYAHERYFVPLGAGRAVPARALLLPPLPRGSARARRRRRSRPPLRGGGARARFAGTAVEEPPAELDRATLGTLAGGELAGYLDAREGTVATLVADVAAAARAEGARFEFIDLAGAVKGYATGRPEGTAAPSISWRPGVDVAAVAAACDGVSAIGYAAEPGANRRRPLARTVTRPSR